MRLLLGLLLLTSCDLSIRCAANEAILLIKKGCGFEDLLETVTMEGTAVMTNGGHGQDGDWTFDVVVDPLYDRLRWYHGRETIKPGSMPNTIHVEFTPCQWDGNDRLRSVLTQATARLAVSTGVRVKITGQWAYDGVDHSEEHGGDIVECVEGIPGNPDLGWTEIHAALDMEILD